MSNEPTKDPTGPQSPKLEHNKSMPTMCRPSTAMDAKDSQVSQSTEELRDKRLAEIFSEANCQRTRATALE